MFQKLKQKSLAFSLAEVLIATAVLALVLFAVLSVNSHLLKLSTKVDKAQIAASIGASQMSIVENILASNFHTPPSSLNTGLLSASQHEGFFFQVFDLGYENSERSLRAVGVRVFWEEKEGPRHRDLRCTFYDF